MKNNKETVCAYPWNSVYIDGSIKTCCNALSELLTDDGNITTLDDLDTIRDSNSWNEVKQDLLDGVQNSHCDRCWKMEPNSFRKTQNEWFPETYDKIIENDSVKSLSLQTLTLAIGNQCNLNCRMCDPGASSMIEKEWQRESKHPLGRRVNLRPDVIVSDSGQSNIFLSDPRFLDFVKKNSEDLRDIYMFGGEPFIIIEEHLKFLQALVDTGNSKNILIRYSTNGTNTNLRRFKDLWKNFRAVDIQVSCDGMEEVYDYIRWPSKWSKMKENLKVYSDLNKYEDNITCTVGCTVQNFTITSAEKFRQYIKENYALKIYYIPVDYPSEFSLKGVPLDILKKVYKENEDESNIDPHFPGQEQLKSIMEDYINTHDQEESVKEYNNMLKVVKWQDEYRDQTLYDFFPDIKEWFADNPNRNNYDD